MQLDRLPFGAPTLEDAIDSNPLVVAPETPLMEAMALMIQTRGSSCSIANPNHPSEIPIHEARSSCVLVMQGDELLGIFTERDIVRLTAAGLDFAEVRMAEVMAQPVVTLNETDFQDIFAALFLFRRYRIRHLVIVTEQKKVSEWFPQKVSVRSCVRQTYLNCGGFLR